MGLTFLELGNLVVEQVPWGQKRWAARRKKKMSSLHHQKKPRPDD